MTPENPTPTLSEAALAFRRFFDELREAFYERETLLTQVELALLCREHVLVTGPPGTAKSALANAVLGRIVDAKSGQPSLFSKQISEATVQSDLIGPVNFKTLTETGRTEYLTEDGMLGAIHAFLDEVFDGRDMLLRSILNVLHERELKHGRKVTAGRLECAVMTSNRYLSEAVSRAPELLLAFADRLSFICYVPKSFARPGSRAAMLRRANLGQRPDLRAALTIQDLDTLQAAVEKVEVASEVIEGIELLAVELERALEEQVVKLPDYVPTKSFSQRSMVKALWALKAFVVRDRIFEHETRPLEARIEDLAGLRHFFLLGGPPPGETDALLKGAIDPRERAQLEIIRLEHQAFDQALQKARATLPGAAEREASGLKLKELRGTAEGLTRNFRADLGAQQVRALLQELVPGPRHPQNRNALLACAAMVLDATQSRLSKGIAGHGEGMGGEGVLFAFRDALTLAQRVPELSARALPLAQAGGAYALHAVELAALSTEGAEFEPASKLDALAGVAERLEKELAAVREVLSTLAATELELARTLAAKEHETRSRIARSLRRRAVGLVGGNRRVESFETIANAGRRLDQLERALRALDPRQPSLREEVLVPLAVTYARGLIADLAFERLEQLAAALRALADDLQREGLSVGAVLGAARAEIAERLEAYAKGIGTSPPSAKLLPQRALSGEAYADYRQGFVTALEGERAALETIAHLVGGVDAKFAATLKKALIDAELNSLQARSQFLKGWLAQLLTQLPAPDDLAGPADAEPVFERLVRSRFPLLAMKEGELLKLDTSLAGLADEGGAQGASAASLRTSLQKMSEDFGQYSKALLEVRARNGR